MTAVRSLLLAGAAAVAFSGGPARADGLKHGFLDRIHKDADGKEARYVLFVPHDYSGDKPYPLVLFLHGSGETGTDGKRQAAVGLGAAVRKQEKAFPFLALFPQSQTRTWQADSAEARRALAILDDVEKDYKVDPKRVYLTGLSMGGFGTWSLAAKYPDRWAAIVPACGGGDAKSAGRFKDVPCWAFHGDKDRAVPASFSRRMIDALQTAGGKPKYTEYPGVDYFSWDRAYGTPELYSWLLEQHK